jgi:erythritol transport system substrate-binding protein
MPNRTELSRGLDQLCRTLFLAVLIVGAASGMTSPAYAQSKNTIAIIIASDKIPYFTQFVDSARVQCAKLGYETVVLSDDFQESNQIDLFEDATRQKCAAIICTSAYSKSLVPHIKVAQHAGIVCVCVGEGIDTSDVPVVHIMADDYLGASAGAEQFVKLLGGSGKYVELLGPSMSSTARIRSKGYNNTISLYSDLQKVDAPMANWQRKSAFDKITSTLQRYPDIKGIISANDEMALGAEDALQAAGLKDRCVVVGFDGFPEAIQSVLDHGIQATVQLPVREMAGFAIHEADTLIKSGAVYNGEERLVDCRLVDYEEAKRLADRDPAESNPRITSPVPNSPWPTSEIFGSLQASVIQLLEGPLTEQSGAKENLYSIQNSGKYLEGFIKEQKVGPPPEYLYCLTIDAWQLANVVIAAATLGSGGAGFVELARDVEQVGGSMRSKVEHAQKNPTEPFAKVAVKVTTKDSNNSEVSSLQVFYCLVGLMRYPDKHVPFDKFSSPTTQGISPGNYKIWASQAGKKGKGPYKDALDIGGGGESERSVDVVAP